jgi:hypothetical protein
MPKKKRPKEDARLIAKGSSIKVRDISDVSGTVNIAGGDITTHQTTSGLTAAELRQLFDQLYQAIDSRAHTSPAAKEDLKAEVKEIESTVKDAVQKDEKMDESFLSRRFRNIARMAPDMLDVIVATLANPLAGLGLALKKIAEKAKAETK